MKAVPDFREAITFLEALRSPPWLITAIAPDSGKIETISAKDAREARNFLHKHVGERNMYYSVNPSKAPVNRKAKKEDIAAVEYVHADLDPADGESPFSSQAALMSRAQADAEREGRAARREAAAERRLVRRGSAGDREG